MLREGGELENPFRASSTEHAWACRGDFVRMNVASSYLPGPHFEDLRWPGRSRGSDFGCATT